MQVTTAKPMRRRSARPIVTLAMIAMDLWGISVSERLSRAIESSLRIRMRGCWGWGVMAVPWGIDCCTWSQDNTPNAGRCFRCICCL